ncbi:chain-length determining protein [Prevotella sp. P6B1]|uniref:chain-length determining protein n=1 Tax=Prevotella sp. P6B1 TaxID=1410613 RepID=UPI0018CBF9E5|nr:chain-length determining protein [Prevotella sp. P6B1]
MLSPESSNGTNSLGGLSTLTSLIGADINLSEDAISPMYYPNILKSKKFIVSIFDIQVTSLDGSLKTTLYEYCKSHQKEPWWCMLNPMKLLSSNNSAPQLSEKVKPSNYLSQEEWKIAEQIENMLTCKLDPKDGFITITATAQDPLISTELVDSVSNRLQSFIINYRTSKARHDVAYLQDLYNKAEIEYDKARIRYASYSDAHDRISMKSYSTKEEELENQMQIKFNICTQLLQQLQIAKGKVLERTPVYAVIEPAIVPIRKSSPKTMLITLAFMIIAFMGTSAWILYKYDA